MNHCCLGRGHFHTLNQEAVRTNSVIGIVGNWVGTRIPNPWGRGYGIFSKFQAHVSLAHVKETTAVHKHKALSIILSSI